MKTRAALLVIVLVILPTAVLSLMAGRTLRSWELILRRGLETTAANAVESVADQVQAGLQQDMKRVAATTLEALARGGESERIEAASLQLSQSGGTIKQIYLFVNPLAFVYPLRVAETDPPRVGSEQADAVAPGEKPSRLDSLAEALKREIAAGPSRDTLRFTVGDASYLFSPIRDRKDLYVGYEVDPARFARQLSEIIAGVSGGGFALVAEGPGLRVGAPRRHLPAEITVTDSLGQATTIRDGGSVGGRDTQPLAAGRLYRPFDFVRISAFVKDPEAVARTGKFRVRLYGWGILLMAGVIVAGVWLLWREAAAEIRRARAKSEFVMGVSHDLRTPLASMQMLADSLHMGRVPDPAKQKQFLATIVRECQRLSQLIERVLFFVRFGQDAMVYRPRETDVGLLVTREVDAFRMSVVQVAVSPNPSAGPSAQAISVAVQPGLSRVMADDGALAQVVLNLLDNAWKYGRKVHGRQRMAGNESRSAEAAQNSNLPLEKDEATIAVTVATVERARKHKPWEWRRKWIRVSVSDHGDGIRRSDLGKIFRRFYRASDAGDKNTSGVGLGLALCKHVATAHGGWIEVESTVGKGSTFSVYLPVEGKAEKRRQRVM